MSPPKSFEMASQTVKDFYESVLDQAAKFLMENGFTARAAVTEVDSMRPEAFEKALNRAMEVSATTAVQSDWLILITTGFVWLAACERCEIPEERRPYHILDVPNVVELLSPGVAPSPDHLLRIKQVLEKQLSDVNAQLAAVGSDKGQAGRDGHAAEADHSKATLD